MIQTAIELTLLEAGVQGPLFRQPYCKYVTKTWVAQTWETARCYFDLEMDDGVKGLPLLCVGDRYLMQDFTTSGQFTVTELGHINRCRLFLRVLSLADITTGDGKYLTKWAWDGDVTQRFCPLRAEWPYQERPGARSWRLWRKALRFCYSQSVGNPIGFELGPWLTRDHWWFYSPSTRKLYAHGYAYSPGARGVYSYKVPNEVLPLDAQPARVSRKRRGHFVYEGSRSYQAPPEPSWSSLRQYIDSRPASLQWALQNCEGLDNIGYVAEAIINGTCVIVSDGSFQQGFSTAAYTLTSTEDVGIRLDGRCIVPGQNQSAFRAELGGLYAALHMLLAVVSQMTSNDGVALGHHTVRVGCDGKSALNRVAKAQMAAKGNHFDLVTGILSCLRLLKEKGVSVQMEYVKGHQDRVCPYDLSVMEALNVRVDAEAQNYNMRCREEGHSPSDGDVFGEIGPIWIDLSCQGRVKVVHDIVHITHDLFHADLLKEYWKQHSQVNSDQAIDWEVLKKANSQRTIAQHIFHVKQVSGYIGVGKWMHRWRYRESPACLLCGAEVEDMSHVFTCSDDRYNAIWESEIGKIEGWVVDSTQSSRLSEFIRSLLWAYRSTGPPDAPLDLSSEFTELWEDQIAIGDFSLLNGFCSKKWRDILTGSTGRCTTTTWLARLTSKIYDMCGYIWGKRNEWVNQSEGGRLQEAWLEVENEIQQGAGGNSRLQALLQDGSRPVETSSLGYIQMWLASVKVARLESVSQEERESYSRRIMFQWLRSGNRRHS